MNNHCTEFHPLLSSMLDGELSVAESQELDAHLLDCKSCQQSLATMQQVNGILEDTLSETWFDHSQEQGRGHGQRDRQSVSQVLAAEHAWGPVGAGALGFVGVAAAVLVAISLFWPRSPIDTPPSDIVQGDSPLQPNDDSIGGRLASCYETSLTTKRNQSALCESMAWELRALKLELGSLDIAADQQTELDQRIERLLKKVQETKTISVELPFGLPTDISLEGEVL